MTRLRLLVALFLVGLGPSTARAQPPVPPTSDAAASPATEDRFHGFIEASVKSPAFYVEAVGAGLIDQMNHFPQEWDGEGRAFLKRNVARTGQAFIAAIIEHGAGAALDHHVGYEVCGCKGGLRRTAHAFWRTFVTRNKDDHAVLNVSFLAAKYGSAAVAEAWYPASYRTGDVVSQGSFALGFAVGLNLLDEFSPDLLHVMHLR